MGDVNTEEAIKQLYQEMYEHTHPECGKCRAPRACCHDSHCVMMQQWAKDMWNVELEETGNARARFLGEDGCIAEPHLRPLCTLHTCDVNGLGFKRDDDAEHSWTNRYFDLRGKIEALEYEWLYGE